MLTNPILPFITLVILIYFCGSVLFTWIVITFGLHTDVLELSQISDRWILKWAICFHQICWNSNREIAAVIQASWLMRHHGEFCIHLRQLLCSQRHFVFCPSNPFSWAWYLRNASRIFHRAYFGLVNRISPHGVTYSTWPGHPVV